MFNYVLLINNLVALIILFVIITNINIHDSNKLNTQKK